MALPSDHRLIAVGQFKLRNRKNSPDNAPEFAVADLINVLKDRIANKTMHRSYKKNSRLMWCSDHDEDNHYHQLMLEVGDKNVTGLSFLHFRNYNTRKIDKDEEEGIHYASHVLIKKLPDSSGQNLILVEKVPGIFLSSVQEHFSWAFNQEAYYKRVAGDGNRTIPCRPICEILGHQSMTIREALRSGVLQDVELVAQEESHDDGLDEDPIVKEVVHEARFKVKRSVSEDQARKIFSEARSFIPNLGRRTSAARMFLRIKTANGQIKRTEVHNNDKEILEQTFIQHNIVTDFDQPLPQRYENFCDDLLKKMKEIVKKLRE